jgi:butyrate response factor 1
MDHTRREQPASLIAAGQSRNPWLRHFASEPLMYSSKMNAWYPQKSESVEDASSLETQQASQQQSPFAATMKKLTKKNSMNSIEGTQTKNNHGKSRSRAKRYSDPAVDIWTRLRGSESSEAKLASDMRGLSISKKKSGAISESSSLSTSPPPASHAIDHDSQPHHHQHQHLHQHQQQQQQQSLYKTELCRSFAETGTCRYGLKCQFAHGKEELRPVQRHPKYKTELCKTWASIGTCPYGTRCRFIHPKDDEFGQAFVELERKLEAEKAASRLSVFAEIVSQPSPTPQRQLLDSEARRSENPGSA